MLKNLQIYAIVVVILVIVLSQFTLPGEPGSAAIGMSNSESAHSNSKSGNTAADLLKGTKYDQPIADVKDTINDLNKSLGKVKSSAKEVKELLDIEKSLNKFAEAFD